MKSFSPSNLLDTVLVQDNLSEFVVRLANNHPAPVINSMLSLSQCVAYRVGKVNWLACVSFLWPWLREYFTQQQLYWFINSNNKRDTYAAPIKNFIEKHYVAPLKLNPIESLKYKGKVLQDWSKLKFVQVSSMENEWQFWVDVLGDGDVAEGSKILCQLLLFDRRLWLKKQTLIDVFIMDLKEEAQFKPVMSASPPREGKTHEERKLDRLLKVLSGCVVENLVGFLSFHDIESFIVVCFPFLRLINCPSILQKIQFFEDFFFYSENYKCWDLSCSSEWSLQKCSLWFWHVGKPYPHQEHGDIRFKVNNHLVGYYGDFLEPEYFDHFPFKILWNTHYCTDRQHDSWKTKTYPKVDYFIYENTKDHYPLVRPHLVYRADNIIVLNTELCKHQYHHILHDVQLSKVILLNCGVDIFANELPLLPPQSGQLKDLFFVSNKQAMWWILFTIIRYSDMGLSHIKSVFILAQVHDVTHMAPIVFDQFLDDEMSPQLKSVVILFFHKGKAIHDVFQIFKTHVMKWIKDWVKTIVQNERIKRFEICVIVQDDNNGELIGHNLKLHQYFEYKTKLKSDLAVWKQMIRASKLKNSADKPLTPNGCAELWQNFIDAMYFS